MYSMTLFTLPRLLRGGDLTKLENVNHPMEYIKKHKHLVGEMGRHARQWEDGQGSTTN